MIDLMLIFFNGNTAGLADTDGCLITEIGYQTRYVWIYHDDGTRNWIQYPSNECLSKSLILRDVDYIPKRHNGGRRYNLNRSDSRVACANKACFPWFQQFQEHGFNQHLWYLFLFMKVLNVYYFHWLCKTHTTEREC